MTAVNAVVHVHLSHYCNHLFTCLHCRINPFVHDVVQRAWANGGGIAEIPSLTDHPIPPLPPVTGDPTDPEVKKALR